MGRRALAASALSGALLLLPAAARAAPSFMFVPDPSRPSLPAPDQLMNVADVNGDGVPDLLVRNYAAGTVGVMLGNGDGGFGPPNAIGVGGRPDAVQVADFNGDGHPDLLVELETAAVPRHNPTPEAVEVLLNDGTGGFTVGPPLALHEAGYVLVGDFTGDGRMGGAEVPGCGGTFAGEMPSDGSTIHTLLGDGHGTLAAGPTTSSSTHGCDWVVGDFNGDGRTDLAIDSSGFVGEANEIVVRPGEPDGEFGAPIETAAPSELSFLETPPADLDGNHTLDLLAEDFTEPSSLLVLSGDGTGHFSFAGPYPSGSPGLRATPVLGDFAGSGKPQILTLGKSISVMEPDGDGGLEPVTVAPATELLPDLYVADVNRDGRPDLISGYASTLAGAGSLSVLLDEPAVPSISAPSLSRRRWREGGRLARISSKGLPVGTRLSFSLNVAASVRLRFSRLASARAGRGRRRSVPAGSLVLAAHAGTDRVSFDGRLSRSRRLAPGSYSLSIVATDASGSSRPVTLRFTIVR